MEVILFDQASDQWHAWENSGIVASESGIISASIGLLEKPAPWMGTSQTLWEEKLHIRTSTEFSSLAMQRCKDFKDEAAKAYSQKTGVALSPISASMDE